MNLHLVQTPEGEPIKWAHRSQLATVAGVFSVFGVMPFLLLLMMPYMWLFVPLVLNFTLDIIKIRLRVVRWQDVARRLRFVFNGGYWYVTTRNRLRHARRAVATFPKDAIF